MRQSESSSTEQPTPTRKVAIKPKDVLEELERVPTLWSLEGLDDKIEILKQKAALITQSYTKREIEGLLLCLELRKKYRVLDTAGRPYWTYFNQFDTTNESKIQVLLKKHGLVMRTADIFIPELPDVAVKTMTEFTAEVVELTTKKPRFFVIANEEDFQTVYNKRDPILLAQSPFGFYYHILGAWDTEMLYLPEL